MGRRRKSMQGEEEGEQAQADAAVEERRDDSTCEDKKGWRNKNWATWETSKNATRRQWRDGKCSADCWRVGRQRANKRQISANDVWNKQFAMDDIYWKRF